MDPCDLLDESGNSYTLNTTRLMLVCDYNTSIIRVPFRVKGHFDTVCTYADIASEC